MTLKTLRKIAAVGLSAALLSGCSADDIQLNGKVFDAVGMNTSSTQREAPKLKQRSGIVVPPNLTSLPEPGSGKAEAPGLDLMDYDEKRVVSHDQLERQQQEYCAKHYDLAKASGNQDADLIEGPLGPCRRSAMNLIKQTQEGEE